jgi:hypothetical protein
MGFSMEDLKFKSFLVHSLPGIHLGVDGLRLIADGQELRPTLFEHKLGYSYLSFIRESSENKQIREAVARMTLTNEYTALIVLRDKFTSDHIVGVPELPAVLIVT